MPVLQLLLSDQQLAREADGPIDAEACATGRRSES